MGEPVGNLAGLSLGLLLLERVDEFDSGKEAHALAIILDRLHAKSGGNVDFGGRSYVPLAVMRALPGTITQMQVTNVEADFGSGAAINDIAGELFHAISPVRDRASYLISTSSSFYLQATGPGASVNV